MQVKRLAFYWPIKLHGIREKVLSVPISVEVNNESPKSLQATAHSWRIDMVRPFEKATTWEYKYILAGTNYFSKWDEAIVVRDFTTMTGAKFVRIHVTYKFDVTPPHLMASPSKVRCCIN